MQARINSQNLPNARSPNRLGTVWYCPGHFLGYDYGAGVRLAALLLEGFQVCSYRHIILWWWVDFLHTINQCKTAKSVSNAFSSSGFNNQLIFAAKRYASANSAIVRMSVTLVSCVKTARRITMQPTTDCSL